MPVKIVDVEFNSPAFTHGVKPGEILHTINGNDIIDVLDYRFYQVNSELKLKIKDYNGQIREVNIEKDEYEELGLTFDTYLIDGEKRCRNKCIFCFIDQLPKGMRESLYFKDDDSRLSFLFGNYVTLTNLSDREINRIINMHISPINVSVHTTNPELRVKMMKNKFAGESLSALYKFAESGIKINCQIVSCRGINDGDELIKTLNDLEKLVPSVESIAVVPVGLTKYRYGLFELEKYDKKSALEVIKIVEEFGDQCILKYGKRLIFPADEFYLKAKKAIPCYDFYEDFAQIENGVGMIASFKSEFMDALEEEKPRQIKKEVTVAGGLASRGMMEELCFKAEERFKGLKINVKSIVNEFFGEEINVTGLVTARDLISQLKGQSLGEKLLISSSMLRSEGDLFLDNLSINDVRKELEIDVEAVSNNGAELIYRILGG